MKRFFPNQHYYYKEGKLVKETGVSDSLIHIFYSTTVGRIARLLFVKGAVNRISEWYYNSRWSARKIKPFIKKYQINMQDFVIPQNGFSSFNSFFTRQLKADARTIDDDQNSIVAMADSKLFVLPELKKDSYFMVKNITVNLDKIVGSEERAMSYYGGELFMFRLSMYDYHRFHFPFDCTPSAPIEIKGYYDTVSPLVYKYGIFPLINNHRYVIACSSEKFGEALIVLVGAFLVGKTVCTYQPNIFHKKGDETGYFTFGGSTVLLIFSPKKISISQVFLKNSQKSYETAVLMGQSIATCALKM